MSAKTKREVMAKLTKNYVRAGAEYRVKLHIDKAADALYLRLDESKIMESEEVSPGVILDFNVEGRRVLVEHIPASVCAHCEEATFLRETSERIRQFVHGKGRPVKTVTLDVFAMA